MLETLSSWYRLDTSNRLLPRCRIYHNVSLSFLLSLSFHRSLSPFLFPSLPRSRSLQASRSRLHSAAEYGETDILRLLLSLNADLDLRDKVSTCACTCARAHDSELTVFALNDVASADTDRYRLPHMPKKQHSLSTISISISISI